VPASSLENKKASYFKWTAKTGKETIRTMTEEEEEKEKKRKKGQEGRREGGASTVKGGPFHCPHLLGHTRHPKQLNSHLFLNPIFP
jgi:hypothetical protein